MTDWNKVFDYVFGVDTIDVSPPRNSMWYTYKVTPCTCKTNKVNMPAVKSVIFNKNATVVYFDDGTKCIVRKSDKDEYNREHAVVYAIVKRAYGIVNEDGTVDGNGMGNMLEKVVANGYDQEAHDAAEKVKKEAKQKKRFVGDDDHSKYAWGYSPANAWRDVNVPKRDKHGRFVKKSNRK